MWFVFPSYIIYVIWGPRQRGLNTFYHHVLFSSFYYSKWSCLRKNEILSNDVSVLKQLLRCFGALNGLLSQRSFQKMKWKATYIQTARTIYSKKCFLLYYNIFSLTDRRRKKWKHHNFSNDGRDKAQAKMILLLKKSGKKNENYYSYDLVKCYTAIVL